MSAQKVCFITEDTSERGHAAVKTLLKRLLKSEPEALPAKLRVATPPHWASNKTGEREARIELAKLIATRLGEGAWVVFHYDGDMAWASRKKSTREKDFDRAWRVSVRSLALAVKRPLPDEAMLRLVEMVPYYSIEAWLYRALGHTRSLCDQHCARAHVAPSHSLLDDWHADPGRLDEALKPKDALCIRDEHNAALALVVSLADLDATRKSFAEFIDGLHRRGLALRPLGG